jgi:hypothetical protein
MVKRKVELADVVRKFGRSLVENNNLSPQQTKILHNILQCRTASLGGHEEACDNCSEIRYSYNSCGDRHCPKCQLSKQNKWVEKLQEETLSVKHYHIIFTVPHCLNEVCLWNDKLYYKLLFKSMWETLRTFGYTEYGVESGAVAVLHTWGQNLSLHPHIHCLVPAAGFSLKGRWKNIGKNDKYLYTVQQLSATFKGKFLDSLKRQLNKIKRKGFENQIEKAYQTNWVVFCEAPMSGVKQVIKYLGQYTHRIAISNQRITAIKDGKVHFYAKDYRDNATQKLVKMDGIEFLRRFVQHVLPKGFIRIRRYGIYHSTTKRNLALQFTTESSNIDELIAEKEKNFEHDSLMKAHCCPACKKGKMIVTRELPKIRSPAGHLPTLLLAKLH